MSSIDFRHGDFNNMVPCASIGMIGKRRSGKTTFASRILENLDNRCDRFVVMTSNLDNIYHWRKQVAALYVVMKSISFLQNMRDYQNIKCAPFVKYDLPIPRKHIITLVIDDCGADKSFMHSSIMKDLLSNGRHYGFNLIVLVQYLNQMPTEVRTNLDYIGIFFTSDQRNVEKIYKEFCNVCPLKQFRLIFKALTTQKDMMWICNVGNPETISQCVTYFKSGYPNLPELKPVGSKKVRAYSDIHFCENLQSMINKKEGQTSKIHTNSSVSVDTDEEDGEFDLQTLREIFSDKVTFQTKTGTFTVNKKKKEKME